MNIMIKEGKAYQVNDFSREKPFDVETGNNGFIYVKPESVTADVLHVSEGNEKTGPAINLNFPIELTCRKDCECYKNGSCYACGGCYSFASNQAGYTENFNFFMNHSSDDFITAMQCAIDTMGYNLFRYFTCGDILNIRFFDCMVQIAKNNPSVKFWSYTKKYNIVNTWIDNNGDLPDNLTIIFSHWLNEDDTYFPMDNRHNLPTSEFVPMGKEELLENITHVCPCSDPSVLATCATCDHACHTLKKGESMGLCEHSTKRTKQRDKAIKEAKKQLKQAKRR